MWLKTKLGLDTASKSNGGQFDNGKNSTVVIYSDSGKDFWDDSTQQTETGER